MSSGVKKRQRQSVAVFWGKSRTGSTADDSCKRVATSLLINSSQITHYVLFFPSSSAVCVCKEGEWLYNTDDLLTLGPGRNGLGGGDGGGGTLQVSEMQKKER